MFFQEPSFRGAAWKPRLTKTAGSGIVVNNGRRRRMEQTWFEKTWPGRALDAAAFWCARVAGTSRRPARPEPRDGMGAHQWFLCAGLAVMLCIPHFWWDNLYGVAFSLAVLLTGWREAVRHGRCPLRPTALGPGCWLFLLMCLLATALRETKPPAPGGVVLSGGVCPDLHWWPLPSARRPL